MTLAPNDSNPFPFLTTSPSNAQGPHLDGLHPSARGLSDMGALAASARRRAAAPAAHHLCRSDCVSVRSEFDGRVCVYV